MEILKAHGTGNDFVVLADLDDAVALTADLARALSDRRTGVGGDGAIRLGAAPADQPDADVFMDHRNADGTTAEMCGNGVRVTAKLAVDHGLVAPVRDGDLEVLRVATRGGTKPVVLHRDADGAVAEVTVDMGPPILDLAAIPVDLGAVTDGAVADGAVADGAAADGAAATHDLDVDGITRTVGLVSMGNPHVVLTVDDVDEAPVGTLGPRLETDVRFPAKANVGFAQVVDRATVRLRVWERGVGETLACGTGACAAVVALQRRDLLDDEVTVHLPGGPLTIRHRAGTLETVHMRGPATEVARVTLSPTWLATAGAATHLEIAP